MQFIWLDTQFSRTQTNARASITKKPGRISFQIQETIYAATNFPSLQGLLQLSIVKAYPESVQAFLKDYPTLSGASRLHKQEGKI